VVLDGVRQVFGGDLHGYCLPLMLCIMLTALTDLGCDMVFTGTIGCGRLEEEMDFVEMAFINWQHVGLKLHHTSSRSD